MNYIKDVELFNEAAGTYNMVVEIKKNSKKKTELVDNAFNELVEMRTVKGRYPYYYGCMPKTYAGDGDPLDVILFSHKKHQPLEVVEIIVVGVIKVQDNGEVDDKILAVAANEKTSDVAGYVSKALHFLKTYKGKKADMKVAKEAELAEEAIKIIDQAHKTYQSKNSGGVIVRMANKKKKTVSSF